MHELHRAVKHADAETTVDMDYLTGNKAAALGQ